MYYHYSIELVSTSLYFKNMLISMEIEFKPQQSVSCEYIPRCHNILGGGGDSCIEMTGEFVPCRTVIKAVMVPLKSGFHTGNLSWQSHVRKL